MIKERDHILSQLETAEAKYISSFRLSTPEPSLQDLNVPMEEERGSLKMRISRPRALGGPKARLPQRKRSRRAGPSTAPTSYVAPQQYYRLQNVRGIDDGRMGSRSGEESAGSGPSFTDSVKSRIVGSRFQEFSSSHDDDEPLPIGSRVTLQQGELGAAPSNPMSYGRNHGMDPSSGNEGDIEPSLVSGSYPRDEGMESSRGPSGYERDTESPSIVMVSTPVSSGSPRDTIRAHRDSMQPESTTTTSARPRPVKPEAPPERRETFPMRPRDPDVAPDVEVPLHLRVQAQGPFVRPASGIDHDMLGAVYSDIGEWRSRLKQINAEIMEAQNECYNNIADGSNTRGWLITGRGIRFIPGMELIEGRSKDDIVWHELEDRKGHIERRVLFWLVVLIATVLLAAACAFKFYPCNKFLTRLICLL